MKAFSHQVTDVNNIGNFAARWRWLPGRAHRVVDSDRNTSFLLADGATNKGVAGGHWDKEGRIVNTVSPLLTQYLQCRNTWTFISVLWATFVNFTKEKLTKQKAGSITSVDFYILAGMWWRLGFHGCRKRGVHLLFMDLCPFFVYL